MTGDRCPGAPRACSRCPRRPSWCWPPSRCTCWSTPPSSGTSARRRWPGWASAAALMALLTIVGTFVEYGTTGRAARWFGAGRLDAAVNEGVQASWLARRDRRAGGRRVGEVLAGPLTALLAGGVGPDPARRRDLVPHRRPRPARRAAGARRQRLDARRAAHPGAGGDRAWRRTRCRRSPSPMLVYPVGLGLAGSAVANVVAQAVGAGAVPAGAARATASSLRPQRAVMRAQLVVGPRPDRARGRVPGRVPHRRRRRRRAWAPRRSPRTRSACSCGSSPRCCSTRSRSRAQSLVGAALGGSDAGQRPARRVAGGAVGRLRGPRRSPPCYAAGWAVMPAGVHLGPRRAAPGTRAVAVVRRDDAGGRGACSPWTAC